VLELRIQGRGACVVPVAELCTLEVVAGLASAGSGSLPAGSGAALVGSGPPTAGSGSALVDSGAVTGAAAVCGPVV